MTDSNSQQSSAQSNEPRDDGRERALRIAAQIAISVMAIAALVVHHAFPKFQADNISLALVVIAFLPWLSLVLKSVEIKGLGKFEFLERKVNRLEQQTNALTESSSLAAGAATILVAGKAGAVAFEADGEKTLLDLAKKYVELRKTMPSGWQRTSELTKVFGQMTAASAHMPHFDVSRALSSEDEGIRLAGMAYLYAKPDPQMLDDLISTVAETETAAFNQYWGLKTVENIFDHGGKLSKEGYNKLSRYAAQTDQRNDRYREVRKILQRFS